MKSSRYRKGPSAKVKKPSSDSAIQLTEKYRPESWDDIAGQESICKTLSVFESQNSLSGRAYWISGRSGCGKTSIARILAKKISDRWYTVELDASELTAQFLKEIQDVFMYRPMSCQSRCYIVNEAHGLSKDQVRKLLKITESPCLNENMTWIFTTTLEGQLTFEDGKQDAGPLLSRCVCLQLESEKSDDAMIHRLQNIAQSESLDGKSLTEYKALFRDCNSNMRFALQKIELGEML